MKKQCVVRRYENYWGGLPKLESATFNIIADGSALAMAQQSGESNVSLTIPSNQLSLFENDPQYVVDGASPDPAGRWYSSISKTSGFRMSRCARP